MHKTPRREDNYSARVFTPPDDEDDEDYEDAQQEMNGTVPT